MPEEMNNGGAATGDAAAAQAVADKAKADAAAAAAGTGTGTGVGEETVTIKKSDLQKIESDRDSYKAGLLQKKADERDLHKKDADVAVVPPAATATIDEKKISDAASSAATRTLRDAAERTAKRNFLKSHPEYVDDASWSSLVSHLTFKGNELTTEEIADRMEAAVLEHKRSTGKLDEYLKSERERGIQEGRIQAQMGSGHGTGGGGDRSEGSRVGDLTPKGIEMARAMHTDPAKAAKIDPSRDNVIDVTQKRKS